VPDIVASGREVLTAVEVPAGKQEHFTELRLWNLHKPPQTRTIAKIKSHLASIYRVFLMRGDMVLEFNGDSLTFSEPKILTATPYNKPGGKPVEWRKEVDFILSNGEHVAGFAAIRETGNVATAGFALFRNDRLIVGSGDETYRPHEIFGGSNKFTYQRLFGELHLTGFDVSHTKDGFIWGDRESEFLTELRAQLNAGKLPLLRQAENYRARGPSPQAKNAARKAVAATAKAVVDSSQILEGQQQSEPTDAPPPKRLPSVTSLSEKTLRVVLRGQPWDVTIELVDEASTTDWLTIKDSGPAGRRGARRLALRVGLDSPFMRQYRGADGESVEALLRVAVAVGLAEITAREAGATMTTTVRRNINELLRGSLSHP
jgi:hypothetical protein